MSHVLGRRLLKLTDFIIIINIIMAQSKSGGKDVQPELYRLSLPSDVRIRYDVKIAAINGVDPYTVQPSEFGRDRMAWPDVSYLDVYTYLVCSTSWYTKAQMKAYKGLDAYKMAQDDWIREVLHKQINGFHLMKAKVTHSMRVSEKPLEPWVIVSKDGSVESAHCTCMAGLAEACTHIAAVLFCLETCARVRQEATPTDLPAYWIFPTTTRLDTQFKRLKDMNLQSAAKKRKLNEMTSEAEYPQPSSYAVSSPTKQEETQFFRQLHLTQPDAVVLSIVPGYAQHFEPKASKIGLPPQLNKIHQPQLENASKEDIMKACESVNLEFSQEQALVVEQQTRSQRKSKLWSSMRAGRITASNFKASCRTSVENPSLSLLKSVCTPISTHGSRKLPEAVRWGLEHEKQGVCAYIRKISAEHNNAIVKDCGLYLNPEHPAFGASPDAVVSCDCCGKGCVEIKCPFILSKDNKSYTDLSWLQCDDGGVPVHLDKDHEYYYQVQCQIFLTNYSYCDFVVWSPYLPLVVLRIYPDKDFWNAKSRESADFHKKCVLPELCAKFFSLKKRNTANYSHDQTAAALPHTKKFCVCQGPDDGRRMIKCDNKNCQYVWFHVDCIQMKRVPKGKWLCHTCKSAV